MIVARASSGLDGKHDDEALAPRSQGLALARRLASALRVHRIIQAVELSVLILLAAIADAAARRPHRHPGADRGGAGGGRADDGGAPGGHRGVEEAAMTATVQRTLTLSCVILTMGNRPAEVSRAIDSVLAPAAAPRWNWSWWATAPT